MSSLSRTFKNLCCLSETEVRVANVIHSVISKIIEASDPKYKKLRNEAEMSQKMKQIIQYFDDTNIALSEFLSAYNDWSEYRISTIKELKNISKALHSNRLNGNISRLVGASVGIVGGATVVASVFCPPLLIPLAVGGGIGSSLGGVTIFSTSVAELVIIKQQIGKAKTLLEEDGKRFEPLKKWFERSNQLVAAINELLGFSVMAMLKNDFKEIWGQFQRVKFSIDSWTNAQLLMVLTPIAVALVPQLLPQFGALMVAQVVVFVIVVVCMRDQNRFVLDALLVAEKLAAGIFGVLDTGAEIGRAVAIAVLKNGEVVPQAFSRAVQFGLFAGIGIALDVANIVMTSIDVHKGSVCEHGEKVASVAAQLQAEFDFIAQVYNHYTKEKSLK